VSCPPPDTFDLLAVGRSSIDLYAQQIGAPFPEIESFAAWVGGCPTNVAVGVRRLGGRVALLTGVGEDPVAELLRRFLAAEGIARAWILDKPGCRTSAVLLGIQPPDRFPLVFYRDAAADFAIDLDDAEAAPVERARAVFVTGTGLAREPSRSATQRILERAAEAGALRVLDLDHRADQWHDPRAYGVVLRSVLPLAELVLGTEAELIAAAGTGEVRVRHGQQSAPEWSGDVDAAIARLIARGAGAVVHKRGAEGSRVVFADGRQHEAASFRVEVVNVLGAGDAFAAGLIHARLGGRDWPDSLRLANACGALLVTRHGCANFMPTLPELEAFMAATPEDRR
jgi:5-dehydro-2-deoxygluconokinase